MNTPLKILATKKNFNSAVSMAIISKPVWFTTNRHYNRKCTFCGENHHWTSNYLYYYTNQHKDSQHYLFCESCAHDIEMHIESYHLCHLVLKYILNQALMNDLISYIKSMHINLYIRSIYIPRYISHDI
jgi:hypothetical protein